MVPVLSGSLGLLTLYLLMKTLIMGTSDILRNKIKMSASMVNSFMDNVPKQMPRDGLVSLYSMVKPFFWAMLSSSSLV